MSRIPDLILAILATARLTRVVTTDWIGEWLIVGPFKRGAQQRELELVEQATRALRERNERVMLDLEKPGETRLQGMLEEYDENHPWSWQMRVAKGFDCPFCVGFWIGAGVLLFLSVPAVRPLARVVLAPFALNYVTGHLGSRIDQ